MKDLVFEEIDRLALPENEKMEERNKKDEQTIPYDKANMMAKSNRPESTLKSWCLGEPRKPLQEIRMNSVDLQSESAPIEIIFERQKNGSLSPK
jgi:hypothetical protein